MSEIPKRVTPRIETETARAPRIEIARQVVPDALPDVVPGLDGSRLGSDRPGSDKPGAVDPRWSMPALVLGGFAVLALGLAALQTGNFVAAEFARSPVLGALTLLIAVGGFGLIGLGIWRELRALAALHAVDGLRRDLSSNDPVRMVAAARRWLAPPGRRGCRAQARRCGPGRRRCR